MDDPVSEFYKDSIILITGGTGFLGKVLVEKILRSFEVKQIYLLVRTKNNMTVSDRLLLFFEESVSRFDTFPFEFPNQEDTFSSFSLDFR